MGRKLDLSGLTEEEADHVLDVVQRDMRLRKTEEERLSDLKQELDEEDSRSFLLSRQRGFNQRCCIRCCSPFTFLLKPRRRCLDCQYNVCKRCCSYSSTDKGWLCSSCEKSRLLKTQALEWFYSNVRRRFKRFGSAKVLKTLYRRHIAEQGSQTELTEGSTYDESVDNDDSMYESDSAFYKHSEEHSMAETFSVALRVAEEAIDEAIAKAEGHTDNQEKLNEARYLRDNRGELVEELTTTIVQKIIRRKTDQSEMQPECSVDWPPDQKKVVRSHAPPLDRPRSALASLPSPKTSLWRSRSAFSLFTDEMWHQHGKTQQRPMLCKDCKQGLKKDGVSVSTLPTWKSVDRLDNSMLQSQDGNWIALQSTQLSRPSLLTKRKSQVFSALEKESSVVSAYDGMDSDTEPDCDGTRGAALMVNRNKMFSSNMPNDLQSTSPQPTLKSPTQAAAEAQTPGQGTPVPKFHRSPFPFLKRKVPLYSQRLSVMDINFNPEDEESSEDGLEDSRVKRTRRRRRSKREEAEDNEFPALASAEPDYSRILLDVVVQHRSKRPGASGFLSDQTMDTTTSDIQSSETGSPDAFMNELEKKYALIEDQLTSTLREFTSQVSKTQFSSTEDELDRVEEIVAGGNDHAANDGEDGKEDALWDIEWETEKEESEAMEEGVEQMASKKLQEVEKNGAEMVELKEKSQNYPETVEGENVSALIVEDIGRNSVSVEDVIELENSRNLSTDMIHNLHYEIQTEKQCEMEKTTKIQHDGCLDNKSLTEDLTVLDESVIVNIDNTGSGEQIKLTEDTLCCTRQRVNEENVREVEEDTDTVHRDNTDSEQVKEQNSVEEAHIESDRKQHMAIEKQREISEQKKEETNKGQQVKSLEVEDQTDETDNTAESGEHSVDNAASDRAVKTGENSCDNQDSTTITSEEDKVEYERMIGIAVNTLDNMEEEIEAHDIKMRFGRSYDMSEGEEEIVAEKKEEYENMTQDEEIEVNNESEQDEERVRRNEPPEKRFMEKENEHDLDEKKEEHNLLLQAEQCMEDVDSASCSQTLFLTPEEIYKKYTAASLRSITTEVLKVLNATEDLIQGAMCDELGQPESQNMPALPPEQSKKLDEQLSRLEENVYVAASAVFGLEAELGDLEECARSISGATSEGELAHLEEQVASVAAQVQQSELQVSDIAARIAALKNAGLNVAPQTRFAKPQTIDSSRQHRRRLPAPPMQDKKA